MTSSILRFAPARALFAAQLISLCGDLLAVFAVFSVVSFGLHANAAQVTAVMIAYLLPQIFMGALAGAFVDRWNVKLTMIVSDIARAFFAVALVYSSSLVEICTLMALLSAISSFFLPAQTILLRTIIPPASLMAANGLMMHILQFTQIAIPGLAGLLTGRTGASTCFWLDALSFLFSAAAITTIPGVPTPRIADTGISSIVTGMKAGAHYLLTHRSLVFTILAMAAGGFAASCWTALTPTYVRDILHGAAGLFGLLGTLVGLGTVLGTLALARLEKHLPKERLITTGLFGVTAGILILGVSGNTWLAASAALIAGIGVALIVTPAQTLLQIQTPVEMLGRVFGVLRSVLSLVQIAGLLLAGSIAAAIGIRPSLLTIALVAALLAAAQPYSFSRSTRR